MDNAKQIWNFLKSQNFNDYGIAGIMGNLYAESKLQSNNLQNSANDKLHMTDQEYTNSVDKETYNNFIDDGFGYGLAQWTYNSLKKELLEICKKNKTSISDINSQLECLCQQLSFHKILDKLKNAKSLQEASNLFLLQFERPKDQSLAVQQKRIEYGQQYLNQFSRKGERNMKYTKSNPPIVCMATQSACYKLNKTMKVLGVLWHSTGANNPTLKRYVQPSNDDPKRDELINLIGKNPNNNHQNRAMSDIGLNAWIGLLADGSVATIQTMPWNYSPWGCGGGLKGSCNDGWIQFEICEDSLTDKNYFDKVYKEACELTAYLCSLYGLNPKGTVNYKGIQVPVILCHQDSANLQLGTNHADVLHWFKRYGKTMDNVREDVYNLLGVPTGATITQSSNNYLQIGDQNEKVKDLQQKLIKLCYSCGPDGADGDFGPNTENAVKIFQKNHNLEVDGIVGEETLKAIEKDLSNQNTETIIYRIRKSWSNAKSQIGAFTNLDNAKNACDKAGKNYAVFDPTGKQIYPETIATTIDMPITPTKIYTGVVLGSASHDENGTYRGGQAGDQNSTEVHTQNWYDGGWDTVLRPIDSTLAEKIAVANEGACDNNAIGYDMNQRNTIYTEALKVNLDLSKISTPCECDCSSLVSTCCICAGLPKELYYINNNLCTTWSLEEACQKTGKFQILKDTKYLHSKDYLKRGDILLNTNQHVVIVLSNGAQVTNNITSVISNVPYIVRINTAKLNVRTGPGTNYPIKTYVYNNYKFTIIEEKEGWGKLKSGAGWINLSFTVKA